MSSFFSALRLFNTVVSSPDVTRSVLFRFIFGTVCTVHIQGQETFGDKIRTTFFVQCTGYLVVPAENITKITIILKRCSWLEQSQNPHTLRKLQVLSNPEPGFQEVLTKPVYVKTLLSEALTATRNSTLQNFGASMKHEVSQKINTFSNLGTRLRS